VSPLRRADEAPLSNTGAFFFFPAQQRMSQSFQSKPNIET
jgi:hypothetical protein